MKADYLSFKRATSVSLLGLAIQLVLGLAMLIYAVLARTPAAPHGDHAGLTAAFYILAGSVIWLILAVVFDQHRRERVEAMEAESLAALSARQTTVFEENADDLRVAAKRLAWMHRVLVPAASLIIAAVFIILGFWRFKSGKTIAGGIEDIATPQQGWAIALGLVTAIAGFIFARFVSGMAKQQVWANLRAGAATAAGAALFGLSIAVGHIVDAAGSDTVLRYLPAILPAALIALGIEIVLNFILTIYRPRRAGEIPRPAFDSRFLGFVAAPDRIAESIGGAINYQFGFNVTGSWFYQLLARWLPALAVLGIVVVWAMTFFAVVGPDERGLRIRRGAMAGELEPGLYFKLPWPLETVHRFKTTTARRIDLAAPPPEGNKPILWTNDHGVKEQLLIVQPAASLGARAGEGISDFALVVAEVPVYYEVTDLHKFENFGAPEVRENRLRAIGQRAVLEFLASQSIDDLLGAGRDQAATRLRELIDRRFSELDAGVRVLFAGIEGVHPPKDTAMQFEEVVAMQQASLAEVDRAEAERIATLSKAAGSVEAARTALALLDQYNALGDAKSGPEGARIEQALLNLLAEGQGQAAATLSAARAVRWEKHMGQRARAARYAGQLAAYRAGPDVFKASVYFDTLREVMKDLRVYIVAHEIPVEIRSNLEDAESSSNALLERKEED